MMENKKKIMQAPDKVDAMMDGLSDQEWLVMSLINIWLPIT